MATSVDVQRYRSDLLEAGVPIQIDGLMKPSSVRALVKASRDNPSRDVHCVLVEDAILCGLFSSPPREFLVLPPSRSAFDAVADFLRYEALVRKKDADKARELASAIERLGASSKISSGFEPTRGDSLFLKVERNESGAVTGKKLVSHKAELIGPWAIGKSPVDKKSFSVWHARLGNTVVSPGFKKKSSALHLARSLAEMRYPWRLLSGPEDLNRSPWSQSSQEAWAAITQARSMDSKAGQEKSGNPKRWQEEPLFVD